MKRNANRSSAQPGICCGLLGLVRPHGADMDVLAADRGEKRLLFSSARTPRSLFRGIISRNMQIAVDRYPDLHVFFQDFFFFVLQSFCAAVTKGPDAVRSKEEKKKV